MKTKHLSYILLICFSIMLDLSYGQLSISTGMTPQEYGDNIAGSNISVTNATISGEQIQFGTFQYVGTDLPVQSGVVLSTGSALDAVGPNNSTSTSGGFFGAGNNDLSALNGTLTRDAAILEFQFEVQSDEIGFNFVFMSEEYNEYVGTEFNDVFAFYISGPGIVGQQNLALVPGTLTPITINTINNSSFFQYYTDNTLGAVDIEYDGFTTLLTAYKNGLVKCGQYTLSIRIADGSDDQYDSAVLIQENSLVQSNVSAVSNTYSANNTALEGCIDASFTFELSDPSSSDLVIPIGLGGSAVNGVDYAHVDNQITIPAGQTAATIIIDAFADGITEGQESIEIYFTPSPCAPPDTVVLYIDDYAPIEYTVDPTDVSCYGIADGMVDFTVTGGAPPYTISLTDSATGIESNYATNPVLGLDIGTYYVEVLDGYGCSAEDVIAGNFFDAGQTFIPDGQGGEYTSDLPLSGFGTNEILQNANQIQSICATMEHSRIGELEITLTAPNGIEVVLKEQPGGAVTNLGEPCAIGPADAGNTDTLPGIGYNYCWQNISTFGTMVSEANSHTYSYTNVCDGSTQSDKYLPAGSYQPYESFDNFVGTPMNGDWTITVKDHIPHNNGYIFDWSITLQADPADSVFTIFQPDQPLIANTVVEPDCGLDNGSIDISVNSALQPVTFQWSNGATSEDLVGVPAGTYTVDITDASGCVHPYQVNLSNNGILSLSGSESDETCFAMGDGSINIDVLGAIAPITYTWDTGQTSEDLNNVPPGNYTVTVEDSSECLAVQTFTITAASEINIAGVIENEVCGDNNGTIDITVYGAINPVSFAWSDGTTLEDAVGLEAGNHIVTITDSNNCNASQDFDLINLVGNCLPDCDLEITSAIVIDEMCGAANGEIHLSVSTTQGPAQLLWSNGLISSSLIDLPSGDYDVSISDVVGCEVVASYSINNDAGNFAIDQLNVTNSYCGNLDGSIDANVVGGTQPYSYLWSNGISSEDLNFVAAGNYTLTVTDANNCIITGSTEIFNESGTLAQTGYVIDAVCGVNGVIDINVTGGQPPYAYNWNVSPTNSEDQTYLLPGTYFCEITDASGCSITTPEYTVEDLSGSLSIDVIDAVNEICSDASGMIDLTISGGTSPYSYEWSNLSTTQDLANLSAGVYSCTVSDLGGCSVTTVPINITNESGSLSVDDIIITDDICNAGNGSIFLDVSSSNLPITYAWNTNSNSEDLINLTAGNYFCQIMDANGCTTQVSANVDNSSGTLSIDNVLILDESCGQSNGEIDLIITGGTQPFDFLWNNLATTEDLSGVTSGVYTVDLVDATGCSVSASATVNNLTNGMYLDIPIIMNEQCSDASGSIDISVNGGTAPYSYDWSNGAISEDLTLLSSGLYSCTITDANGCSISTGALQVNNGNQGLDIQVESVVNEICSNGDGSIEVSVNNGVQPLTYQWSNGETTLINNGLNAGIYTLTVTDAQGCTAILEQEVLNESGTLEISNVSITDEICGNTSGAIDIDIIGGTSPYIYNWNTGDNIEDLTNLGTGVYSMEVVDSVGCSVSLDDLVVSNQSGSLTLDALNVVDENCGNALGNIDISISGNVGITTYIWSNGETTEDLSNLSAGTYSVIVQDGNGCSLSISAIVSNAQGALNATAEITHLCSDLGSIDLTVVGGVSPINIAWSNFSSDEDLHNLSAGSYSVTISDGDGCTFNDTYVIEEKLAPIVNAQTVVSASCLECYDGSIQLTTTAANGPNTFMWSTGATTESLDGLAPGTYWVQITSPDGCIILEEFQVDNDDSNFDGYECQFNVFPNPTDGLITITYTEWPTDNVELTLFDALGRYINIEYEEISGVEGAINLDLSTYASGVYFLHLNPNCENSVYRLVKN